MPITSKNSASLESAAIDTILRKIDRIEEGQGETIRRLDTLHNAIYEPDAGLFARIKAGDVSAERRSIELEQKYEMLSSKFEGAQKAADADDEKIKKLNESSLKVDELVKWKTNVVSVLMWILISFATGGAGLFTKFIYDWFTGYVKLH